MEDMSKYHLGATSGFLSTILGVVIVPPGTVWVLLAQCATGIITAALSAFVIHFVNRWLRQRDRK